MGGATPGGWTKAQDGRWLPPDDGEIYGIAHRQPGVAPSSGSDLLGVAWRVIAASPVLVVCGLAGLVCSLGLIFGLSVAILGHLPVTADLRFPRYFVLLPAIILGDFPATYANSVVLVAADQRMRGERPDLSHAVRLVNRRLPALISWSLLSGLVGAVLQVLEDRLKIGGRLVTWLVGLSWNVATTFVVPCLVFEDKGVGGAIRRSAHVFKQKWGLNIRARVVTSGVSLGILVAIAIVAAPIGAISAPAGAAVGITLAVVLLAGTAALESVLTAALYRFTVDGSLVGGFTPAHFAASMDRGH